MWNRGLNLYEMIFGAFFVLKVTGEGIQSWNWFWVLLPLIIGFVHAFFSWVYNGTKMKREVNQNLAEFYVDIRKKQFAKKAIRDIKKEM